MSRAKIKKYWKAQGTAIVSVDDDYVKALFDNKNSRKMIPVSVRARVPDGVFVSDNVLKKDEGGEEIEVASLEGFETLKGLHNQQNMAFVYQACKEFGLEDGKILKSFESYPGLAHRPVFSSQKKNNVSIRLMIVRQTNAEAAAKALSAYDNIFWIIGGRAKKNGLQGLEDFKSKIQKSYLIGEATEEFSLWLEKNGFAFFLP